jgi:hypothetical protein
MNLQLCHLGKLLLGVECISQLVTNASLQRLPRAVDDVTPVVNQFDRTRVGASDRDVARAPPLRVIDPVV